MKFKVIDYSYLLFIIVSIFLFFKFNTLNVDSTWILYVSSKIIEGKTLYTDIVEVNPPLIFTYSTFAIYFSKLTSFSYALSFITIVSILISISSLLSFYILKKIDSIKNTRYLIYAIIFILTIATFPAYGQREHLLVIFILPYILYSMFRSSISVPKYILVIVVLFASLGFNLKPHFFLIVIAIEIVYILHFKKIFYFIRWDSFLLFLTGVIYLAFIFTYFPEYINFAVPLALETYTSLFNKPILILLSNYEMFIFILSIFIWISFSKKEFNLDIKILLITIISFLFIYLIQQKGWFYHRLPFFLFTLLFIFYTIFNYVDSKKKLYFLSFIPLLAIIILINIQKVYHFTELENILKNLPSHSKIHILSTDIARGQNLLVPNNQIWASRFGALGILPSTLDNKNLKVKEYLFNSIYEDLISYQPDTIIFCGKYTNFDYYKYFSSQDKRLKNIYDIYYTKSIIDGYTILKKNKEFK